MATISLCMIVRNEEEVLDQCLKSVKDVCDEIIILDTGSTDKTKEIASRYTEQIIDFKWVDNFSAARNVAFSYATKDFIFWLDADDVLLESDLVKMKKLKEELDSSIDAVSMKYHTNLDENGNPTFTFRRNRLVKRVNQYKWYGAVHEYLKVWGNIYHSDIAVIHKKEMKTKISSYRNIRIYEKRLKKGEVLTPRDLYYYANELMDHEKYKKAIKYYNKFLATHKGWVEDQIRACLNKADCYKYLGEGEKELHSLFQSLKYDSPRAEFCCRIGDYFLEKGKYEPAVYWYHCAINNERRDTGGFQNPDYWTWYPHLQLCVCYWGLKDKVKSSKHNEKAAEYRPKHPSVLANRSFFLREGY